MQSHLYRVKSRLLLLCVFSTLGVSSYSYSQSLLQRGLDLLSTRSAELTEQSGGATLENLSAADISGGLRQALIVGSENVVRQLGQSGGFSADEAIHIPLPQQVQAAKSWLDSVGMGGSLAQLEEKLNQAAEESMPAARELFVQAITEMSIEDARAILAGSDSAATEYLQDKMAEPLSEAMKPVVERKLNEVGAVQQFNAILARYKTIPLVPDLQADITEHTISKGLEGVFYYLAKEEAAIRQDPVKRSTDLLKKVFSAAR